MEPRFRTGGPAIRLMLATNPVERFETVSAASVRGHIWVPSDSVNAFLQFYFKEAQDRRISAGFAVFRKGKNGYGHVNFKSALTIFCQRSDGFEPLKGVSDAGMFTFAGYARDNGSKAIRI